jgi:SPP1 gp7 family putative phage head morphogenesis protein
MEAMKLILLRVWATGYILGTQAAEQILDQERKGRGKAAEITKAEAEAEIDWSTWKPGDEVAALLLKPPKAFTRMLERAGITIKEMTNTTLRDIGNSIGEAIALGLTAKQSAKLINRTIADPSRALMIAITEQNRAISYATVNRYREAGLEQMEWLTSDPCPTCALNEGQKIQIGSTFNSGHTQPPAHPHCRCTLLPVIPGFDEPTAQMGGRDIAPDFDGIGELQDINYGRTRRFSTGKDDEIYQTLKQEQRAYIEKLQPKQLKAVQTYQSMEYEAINDGLRGKMPLSATNKQTITELDKVIKNASLDYNTTVYRGIIDDTGVFDQIRIGDTIKDKGFLSTSVNPAVAEAFANGTIIEGKPIVLEIDVPAGSPALASDLASAYLADDLEQGASTRLDDNDMIAEIAGYVRLNEITLPRNLSLEVTEIIKKENATYFKTRIK